MVAVLFWDFDRIRIRFTYPKGKRNDFYAGEPSDRNWQRAIATAQTIDNDIYLGTYDPTLAKYKPDRAKSFEIVEKQPNLIDLWEAYKNVSQNRVAATTIKKHWQTYENNYLGKTPKELLELNKAGEFIAYLLTRYKPGTLLTIFSNCLNPSVNLAVRTGKIDRNLYKEIPLQKSKPKAIEAYEPEEVRTIVGAFYSDEYVKKGSIFPHSFYAPMIDFLALVGCRPSECHALTWDDIKRKKDRTYIRFNKAYSNGILLPHTKTYETRLFPVNEQLEALLNSLKKTNNPNNLIFTSVTGGYVNQKTFGRRYWNTVIDGLMRDGKLDKKLRCYSLRHSFITRCVRSGKSSLDIATVAQISGNSSEIIMKHYLAARDNYVVPLF